MQHWHLVHVEESQRLAKEGKFCASSIDHWQAWDFVGAKTAGATEQNDICLRSLNFEGGLIGACNHNHVESSIQPAERRSS